MTRPAEVVLLVDDIRDHAVNYEAALTRHGFNVRVATTGEEALRVARGPRRARAAWADGGVFGRARPAVWGWAPGPRPPHPPGGDPPPTRVRPPEGGGRGAGDRGKWEGNARRERPPD